MDAHLDTKPLCPSQTGGKSLLYLWFALEKVEPGSRVALRNSGHQSIGPATDVELHWEVRTLCDSILDLLVGDIAERANLKMVTEQTVMWVRKLADKVTNENYLDDGNRRLR